MPLQLDAATLSATTPLPSFGNLILDRSNKAKFCGVSPFQFGLGSPIAKANFKYKYLRQSVSSTLGDRYRSSFMAKPVKSVKELSFQLKLKFSQKYKRFAERPLTVLLYNYTKPENLRELDRLLYGDGILINDIAEGSQTIGVPGYSDFHQPIGYLCFYLLDFFISFLYND